MAPRNSSLGFDDIKTPTILVVALSLGESARVVRMEGLDVSSISLYSRAA